MGESKHQDHTHEPEEIKTANFYLYYSFVVSCPYCGNEIISDPDEGLPFSGEEIECLACELMFELGEAV